MFCLDDNDSLWRSPKAERVLALRYSLFSCSRRMGVTVLLGRTQIPAVLMPASRESSDTTTNSSYAKSLWTRAKVREMFLFVVRITLWRDYRWLTNWSNNCVSIRMLKNDTITYAQPMEAVLLLTTSYQSNAQSGPWALVQRQSIALSQHCFSSFADRLSSSKQALY